MAGTLLGVLLGSVVTGTLDRRRWRREWFVSRVKELTPYNASVCRAVDGLLVVHGQQEDVVAGRRGPLPDERVPAADGAWREVLSTRYVYASGELQRALGSFDSARALSAEALNARAVPSVRLAAQRLEARRLQVLDAVQMTINDINAGLTPEVAPKSVRLWHAIRRRPVHPVGQLPSEMAEAEAA